jgi:hypothetical protein
MQLDQFFVPPIRGGPVYLNNKSLFSSGYAAMGYAASFEVSK